MLSVNDLFLLEMLKLKKDGSPRQNVGVGALKGEGVSEQNVPVGPFL